MIRAASIPHLGQTTPTAALGLRAIRSLLTCLDADPPVTVLGIPVISVCPRIGPRVSVNESLLRCKRAIFAIYLENMQETALPHNLCTPYICGYDARGSDISVTRQKSVNARLRGCSDMFVTSRPYINAIVGIRWALQSCYPRKSRKHAEKRTIAGCIQVVYALL